MLHSRFNAIWLLAVPEKHWANDRAYSAFLSLSPHRRRRRRTHIQTRVVIQVGANQASVRERGASWLVIARDAMHTRTFYAIVNVNLTIELRSTTDGHLR